METKPFVAEDEQETPATPETTPDGDGETPAPDAPKEGEEGGNDEATPETPPAS